MENRTVRAFGDQLGLDDEANSQIADGYATGSSARRGVAVGDLPTSSVSPVQLIPPREAVSAFCADGPFKKQEQLNRKNPIIRYCLTPTYYVY